MTHYRTTNTDRVVARLLKGMPIGKPKIKSYKGRAYPLYYSSHLTPQGRAYRRFWLMKARREMAQLIELRRKVGV